MNNFADKKVITFYDAALVCPCCASDRVRQPGQAPIDRFGGATRNRRGLAEPSGNDRSNRVVGTDSYRRGCKTDL